LIAVLSAFGISSGVASDKNEAKHSSKITKARAERIALTKVPGGSIRSAELETARGQRFWSVYIAKPGSKNAKEIRVDATSGQILLCKRKDQKIRPKSLQKPIKRLASGEGFNLWITKSRKTLIEY
jgi:hypothetical protein